MLKSYATEEYGTSDDIEQFRKSFAEFCGRIAELSADNPPRGTNAASENFRDRMLDDTVLTSLIPPRGTADDPEAAAIFQILSMFEQGIRGSFTPENYESSWLKSGRLAQKALEELKGELGTVIGAIGSIALTPAAIAALATSVEALVDKVNSSGMKFDGKHANGWIQPNMKAAATTALNAITPFMTTAKDENAKKLAEIVGKTADQITRIPDFENKPWLYAEWQLRFQAIMTATAETLKATKTVWKDPVAEPVQPVAIAA